MKKRLLSLLLAVSLMAGMLSTTAYADTMPFTDLEDGAWYLSAVQYAYDNGLMNGMTATTFAPNKSLSRAMFVTILGRMAGINKDDYTGSTGFTDAPAGAWYAPYVKWAAESGIVNGMTPTTFAPDANITREQMAAILVRYVENNDLYLPASSKAIASFADEASVSEWAEELVDQARIWGIFAGNDAGNFTPQSSATRAEAATVFMRLEEYLYLSSPEADSLMDLDEEHIATDEETGIRFVDNTVLAYTQNYLTDEEKQSIADLVDGEIVGQISGALDMLQIQVKVSTLAELETMMEVLESSALVDYATYDILVEVENTASTSESTIDGNWWRDAINLDEAWEKYSEFYEDKTIKVGVIDGNIDFSNALLGGRFQRLPNYSLPDSGTDHGTTVSYLFAGIGGVVDTDMATGYFASWNENGVLHISKVTVVLDHLVESGCTVINNSYGVSMYFDPDNMNDDEFWDDVEYFTERITIISCILIRRNNNRGKDQLMFVQAAGNSGISSLLNGFWSSITYSTKTSWLCSKYGVSYQDLKDHILIVSAVENSVSDNTYSVPSWTNYGNIDICAPGADIRESSGTIGNGTSYAAPIVSGVAALVWAAAPDLTAGQLKEILTTAIEYQGVRSEGTGSGTYPMVNALAATDAALQTLYEGTVINSITNEPLEGATIRFYSENEEDDGEEDELLTSCVSDETGEFIAYVNRLAVDYLTVEKDGYIIAELDIDEEMTKYNYSATALEEEEKQTPYQLGEIPLFDLSLYAEELENYTTKSDYRFGLLYIDEDDYPELVIMKGAAHISSSNFYFIQDSELCLVENSTQYGSFQYASKANRLWFSGWSNGAGPLYALSTWTGGDSFTILTSMHDYSYAVENGYDVDPYVVDGVAVTQAQYEAALANLASSQDWITCSFSDTFKITTANIEDMLENPESYIIG